jgi:hypothetical protein
MEIATGHLVAARWRQGTGRRRGVRRFRHDHPDDIAASETCAWPVRENFRFVAEERLLTEACPRERAQYRGMT